MDIPLGAVALNFGPNEMGCLLSVKHKRNFKCHLRMFPYFLYKILWSDFMVFVFFLRAMRLIFDMKISIATNPEPFLNWNFLTQCWIKEQVLEKERLIVVVVVVVCFTLHFTCTWSAISQEFTNVRVFFSITCSMSCCRI